MQEAGWPVVPALQLRGGFSLQSLDLICGWGYFWFFFFCVEVNIQYKPKCFGLGNVLCEFCCNILKLGGLFAF